MAKTKAYIPPHYADEAAYVADLERELAGYRNRVAELKAMHVRDEEGAMIDAVSGEAAVEGVLKSLKPAKAKASE
jgi:hypothetical protein